MNNYKLLSERSNGKYTPNEIKQLEKTGVVFKTGDRLKLKGFAIFGTCLGIKNNKVLFNDEETHEIRYYNINKVEKSYDKWR